MQAIRWRLFAGFIPQENNSQDDSQIESQFDSQDEPQYDRENRHRPQAGKDESQRLSRGSECIVGKSSLGRPGSISREQGWDDA